MRLVEDGRSRTGPKGVMDDYKDAQKQMRNIRMRQKIGRERETNRQNVQLSAAARQPHKQHNQAKGDPVNHTTHTVGGGWEVDGTVRDARRGWRRGTGVL